MPTPPDKSAEPSPTPPAAPAVAPPPTPPVGSLAVQPTATPPDTAPSREQLLAERARIEAQLRETAPPAADEPFTRSTWAGRELLECRYCPWTTFSESDAYEHQTDSTYRELHRLNPAFPR